MKALKARCQQLGHSTERPTNYYYQKLELLQTVHDWNEQQLVGEILNNAPDYWKTIIQTTNIHTLQQLSDAIEYHKHTLSRDLNIELSSIIQRVRDLEKGRSQNRTHQVSANETLEEQEESDKQANAHLAQNQGKSFQKQDDNPRLPIGFHPSIKPEHKPVDSVVSKGKTPEQ